jgi:hypothetical protein
LPLAASGTACSAVDASNNGWVSGIMINIPFGCADGWCSCPSGELECDDPRCARPRAAGERCDGPGDACEFGTTCTANGQCEISFEDRFTRDCSP